MTVSKEKQVMFTVKLLKELLHYESETGVFYWLVSNSNRIKVGDVAGCVNPYGYVVIRIDGHLYRAHRLAWLYVYGNYPEGKQPFIDHINGNPSDNRITNLRCSSLAENQKNRKINSNNKSGVLGVSREKKETQYGTKIYTHHYWKATWCDENGKQWNKNFSIRKLGEDEAKQAAIVYRTEQIRLLELNHGIIYSDRHGV